MFRLGSRMLFSRWGLHGLCIMQILITVIAANALLSLHNGVNYTADGVQRFSDENAFACVPVMTGDPQREDGLMTQSLLNIKSTVGIAAAEVPVRCEVDINEKPAELILYGEKTIAELAPAMQQGSWFQNNAVPPGNIPCVVQGKDAPNIGRVFSLQLEGEEKRFQVVGVMKRGYPYFYSNVGSSTMVLSNFYSQPEENVVLTIFCADTQLEQVKQRSFGTKILVFPSADMPAAHVETIKMQLSKACYVFSFPEIVANTREENSMYFKGFLPLVIALLCIGLFGMIGITILSTISGMRTFSIFYISGMPWSKSVRISLYYIACILLSVVLALTLCYFYALHIEFFSKNELLVRGNNAALTGLLLALVSACASFLPMVYLRKNSAIYNINHM